MSELPDLERLQCRDCATEITRRHTRGRPPEFCADCKRRRRNASQNRYRSGLNTQVATPAHTKTAEALLRTLGQADVARRAEDVDVETWRSLFDDLANAVAAVLAERE